MTRGGERGVEAGAAVLFSVGAVSAALMVYEVVLMRRLLIERWHHFGYLVISVALLGFGASGTLLALLERFVRADPRRWLWCSAAGLAGALILMPRLAACLPVSARLAPGELLRQAGWWSVYWASALVPFLAGAAHIGAALLGAGPRVGRAYAANLVGSGAGAAGGMMLIARCPLEVALWPALILAIAAALPFIRGRVGPARRIHPWQAAGLMVLAVAAVAAEAAWPLQPAYDEFKYAALLRRLEAQGSARRVARAFDPHGDVAVYESALFHDLAFLAPVAAPPPMFRVLINGDGAGSVLRIGGAEEAGVMDHTLMAAPYRLAPPRPRVALLGEVGGTNVWLALRRAASRVVVVQPNVGLLGLLRGPLADASGRVLDQPGVEVVARDGRSFVEAAARDADLDLIQIALFEGLGGGGGGGLVEDHLLTVEGLTACLRALRPGGIVAACRGVQFPERENVRLFATMVAALERLGVADAARHMVQVRDYLGVCTMALRTPLDDERRDRLRAALREFNLTPVWYDGVSVAEVNVPDALPGPPGETVDWLHYAAREILSPRREGFDASWLLNVRPVHDDNPFFWDFYRPGAAAALRQAYGERWLTRAEAGRLFLYASLGIGGVAAVVLILVPLGLVRVLASVRAVRAPVVAEVPRPSPPADAPRSGTLPPMDDQGPSAGPCFFALVCFAAIGLAFMGVEMALISRATRVAGDAVMASAAVIGGVLVLSGLGSLASSVLIRVPVWAAAAAASVLAALVGAADAAGLPTPFLLILVIGLTVVMGSPMPTALARLDAWAPRLVAWAWGVNGVASVVAASAAVALAMEAGYRAVWVAATLLYACAAGAGAVVGRQFARRETCGK